MKIELDLGEPVIVCNTTDSRGDDVAVMSFCGMRLLVHQGHVPWPDSDSDLATHALGQVLGELLAGTYDPAKYKGTHWLDAGWVTSPGPGEHEVPYSRHESLELRATGQYGWPDGRSST